MPKRPKNPKEARTYPILPDVREILVKVKHEFNRLYREFVEFAVLDFWKIYSNADDARIKIIREKVNPVNTDLVKPVRKNCTVELPPKVIKIIDESAKMLECEKNVFVEFAIREYWKKICDGNIAQPILLDKNVDERRREHVADARDITTYNESKYTEKTVSEKESVFVNKDVDEQKVEDDVFRSAIPYDFTKDPDKPFISEEKFNEIVDLLSRKKNIILQGAPGVGKTFLSRKVAYQLIGKMWDGNIETVQFHQSYGYEDFVQGLRPTKEGGFEVRNGVFYNFCEKAKKRPDEVFVFIIDEINRGNPSKIFGELMMLMECDKRSPRYAMKLTYSERNTSRFYVPENVYVIGCMNTADRSIAIVDYALRRRFAFCDVEPEFGDAFKNYLGIVFNKDFIEEICKKINRVNDVIRTNPSLGKGLEIGHSYFCQIGTVDDEQKWWQSICKYELFPYLREICFDDEGQYNDLCNILSR